jgi:anti-sigma factor (TIGR02949 family)
MSCELTHTSLHGYLDGELDAERAAEFERHLENCSLCAAELEAQERLRKALLQADLYERAPQTLRRNVLGAAGIREERMRRPGRMTWNWLAVAAAAAVLLAAMTGWGVLTAMRNRGADNLAAQLVDAHLRSLQGQHLEDVISTDQHTVKPWFDGKIGFAPPVTDFAGEGFPLEGGRLEVVRGRNAAALVYGRRKHIINVFIWLENDARNRPGEGETLGYHWIEWHQGGMEFFAVTDAGMEDLRKLKELIKTAS